MMNKNYSYGKKERTIYVLKDVSLSEAKKIKKEKKKNDEQKLF
jgi:hypothetical protein